MNNTINFEKKNTLYAISDMLYAVEKVICSTEIERDITNHLLRKTLIFGKLKEKLSIHSLKESSLALPCTIYTIRKRLLQNNVIVKLPKDCFCLNILGIVNTYQKIFFPYYTSVGNASMKKIYIEAKVKMYNLGIKNIYSIKGNEERELKLREALKESKIKMTELKAKRRKKLMNKELKYANEVQSYSESKCEEFNVQYLEGVEWIIKEKAQAKRWLESCYRIGINPKEILDKVCENWKDLNRFVRDRQGTEVLSTMFSFPKFYLYRREIEEAMLKVKAQRKINIITHRINRRAV